MGEAPVHTKHDPPVEIAATCCHCYQPLAVDESSATGWLHFVHAETRNEKCPPHASYARPYDLEIAERAFAYATEPSLSPSQTGSPERGIG